MSDRSRLLPELEAMLATAAALGGPSLSELDVEGARAMMERDCRAYWGAADLIAAVEDRGVGARGVPVRLYRPAAGRLPAVVYLHGGGWVIGSIETHDGLCRSLANEAQAVVVSVAYRLAPEHPFPAAPDDVAAVVGWLFEHAPALEIDAARISIAGDSAGGNLAAVAARHATRRGLTFASQVLIYPVTDTAMDTPSYEANGEGLLLERSDMSWFLDHYLPPGSDRSAPDCAPLQADDVGGLPRAYVATCELDPLRDEGAAYARRLAGAGVAVELEDWLGLIHGFVLMRSVTPAANALRRQVVRFLRESWAVAGV